MLYDDSGFEGPLTATHIMDMANLIDAVDTQWISNLVLEHGFQ